MANSCSWAPQSVTLHDGRTVLSNSEEWRAECEAVWLLKKHHVKRMETIEQLMRKRGAEAVATLEALMDAVEPMFVLDHIPNKALRHDYVSQVRSHKGPHAADYLTFRVRQLLRARTEAGEHLTARAALQQAS